jgi:hypothetical protein
MEGIDIPVPGGKTYPKLLGLQLAKTKHSQSKIREARK